MITASAAAARGVRAGGAFISRRAACATRVYEAVRRGRMRWLGAHLELLSCRPTAALTPSCTKQPTKDVGALVLHVHVDLFAVRTSIDLVRAGGRL